MMTKEKLQIQDLDQKAEFMFQFWLEGSQNCDIEQFIEEVSKTDEHFFDWLLDLETEQDFQQFEELTSIEKGVFVIYLQKASKLLTYKTKRKMKRASQTFIVNILGYICISFACVGLFQVYGWELLVLLFLLKYGDNLTKYRAPIKVSTSEGTKKSGFRKLLDEQMKQAQEQREEMEQLKKK